MAEYRDLLYALERAEPGVFHGNAGEFAEARRAKGWEVTWHRTRDLSEVTRAEQSGAKICQWEIAGNWTWSDEMTGAAGVYRQCPGGASESSRVEDGRLIVDWYGDDGKPEMTVELTSIGGWIELLTVRRVPTPALEDLTHAEVQARLEAE